MIPAFSSRLHPQGPESRDTNRCFCIVIQGSIILSSSKVDDLCLWPMHRQICGPYTQSKGQHHFLVPVLRRMNLETITLQLTTEGRIAIWSFGWVTHGGRRWSSSAWGMVERRWGRYSLMSTELTLWVGKNSLEIDSGDRSMALWIYLMPLNYILKTSKMVSFI